MRPENVVPEWKVRNSAVLSRTGRGANYHSNKFKDLLAQVAALSKTRLRVDNSAVQVRGRQGRARFIAARCPPVCHASCLEP